MESGKNEIETDYGLGGEKFKVTFYECLRDKKEIPQLLKSLQESKIQLRLILNDVYDKHPEYYQQLVEANQTINWLHSELAKQYNGYITY